MKCTIKDCLRDAKHNKMCHGHYEQVRLGRTITPNLVPIAQKVPVRQRLMSKINVNDDGCWVWGASLDKRGYAQCWADGMMKRAHRVLYQIDKGPLANEESLDHLCLNKACINPEHLEPVSLTENSRRMHMHRRYLKEIDRLRALCVSNGINPDLGE